MRQIIGLWFLLGLVALPTSAGEVYKWVGKDGGVVYSDQPRPGAEKVELPEPTIYTPVAKPPAVLTPDAVPPKEPAAPGHASTPAAARYRDMAFLVPADQETLWNTEGVVDVQIQLQPSLSTAAGHRFMVWLDGQNLPPELAAGPRFNISHLERGAHTLQAHVVDGAGQVLISAEPVTFHVKQASVLRRPPGAVPP